MRFDRINTEDFGIIRNQTLENLSPGINVIGGMNRAGKTTFTKLLKCFGYGINKGGDIPPANIEYRAEADIFYDGIKDKILLNGYAKPKLSGGKDIETVYGVDYYTYSRLFAIDLEELKKAEKNQDKLQYVLLGGGYRDIVRIPQILKEIEDEGVKIGGTKGDPNTKEFKPYYNNIKNQQKIINESSEKLKEYEGKKKSLKEITAQEENLSSEKIHLEDTLFKLDLLKANFSTYVELMELEQTLSHEETFIKSFKDNGLDGRKYKENYLNLKDKFSEYVKEYEKKFGQDMGIIQRLLEKKEDIININMNASGIKNNILNYEKFKTEIKQEEDRIDKEIISLNGDLLKDKDKIKNIKSDSLSMSKIQNLIENYNDSIKEIHGIKDSLSSLNNEKSTYENLGKSYKENKPEKSYIKYMLVNAVILLIGSLVFIYNKPFGSIIALTGVISAGVYMYMNLVSQKNDKGNYNNLREKYETVLSSIDEKQRKEGELNADLNYYLNEINNIKQDLKMPRNSPISSMETYALRINEINKNLFQLENKKREASNAAAKLNEKLKSIYETVGNILGISIEEDTENTDEIFKEIRNLSESIVICQGYKSSENQLLQCENKIRKEFNISAKDIENGLDEAIKSSDKYKDLLDKEKTRISLEERLKNSIENPRAVRFMGNAPYEYYKNLFSGYPSIQEIERETEETYKKIKGNAASLDSLNKEKIEISLRLKELNSYEKIDEAKVIISYERKSLKPLAEKYAERKAAAFILRSIQKNFMDETKDKLLASGSRIFSQLTSGKYSKIMPDADILSSDFKVEDREGDLIETSGYLSRATSEQLYLSVRLSRIMEIENKLPVILDDSFVNFDSVNMRNAVNVLNKLSISNQIFILTCHRELVEYVSRICQDAEYYSLDEGKFKKSSCDELSKYLR